MRDALGLITGYPGWLTSRFLVHLQEPPTAAWQDELSRYRWRVLVAPGTEPVSPIPPSAEVQVGDVRDRAILARAVQGVDLVLHAAGLIHPRRIADLYSVNRDGTARLAEASIRAGVRRFAFVSSNAAAGFARDAATPMRESDEPRPESHYGHSKRQGEQALWQTLAGSATEGVVLRPTTFYGPHFPRRQLKAYEAARCGRPWLIGDGRNTVSMVYIDNLVAGVGLALARAKAAGQTYFLSDESPYLWQEVFSVMGSALGVQVRPRHLPAGLAVLSKTLDRGLGALGYYSFYIHLAGEATRHMGCSIDKARRELGYCPAASLPYGIREAVLWARARGWL
ncbi:MAG: NAD-dependent epimerase/dehydratase family protein [Candidatus Latescibacteria bacterium]|nr:NAD-dependent epimerase/dehydratase family protein [Candidatus Latescibacterota bacterium]